MIRLEGEQSLLPPLLDHTNTTIAPLWACVDLNHGPLRYQHSALTD